MLFILKTWKMCSFTFKGSHFHLKHLYVATFKPEICFKIAL